MLCWWYNCLFLPLRENKWITDPLTVSGWKTIIIGTLVNSSGECFLSLLLVNKQSDREIQISFSYKLLTPMTDTHLKVSVFSSYQRLTIVLSSKSSHYLSFKKYILLVLQVSYSVLLIQLIFPFSLLGIEIYIPVWDFVLSYVLALMGEQES